MDASKQQVLAPSTRMDAQPRKTVVLLHTWFNGVLDTCVNMAENMGTALGVYKPLKALGNTTLEGKVCIVTGGNAGIGKATAELLTSRGAHVILACRSRERGEAAAADVARAAALSQAPGAGAGKVEVMTVDMASLASVNMFCNAFNARGLPLHLLVANAGVMSPAAREVTRDGLEAQFQVNFLGHWVMAQRLLGEQRARRAAAAAAAVASGKTKRALPSTSSSSSSSSSAIVAPGLNEAGWGLADGGTRVVMLSSLTHRAGCLNWHDMQSAAAYDPFTSYALSKLANAATAVELSRRLARAARDPAGRAWGALDSAVAVHPGVVDTHLAKNFFKNNGLVDVAPAAAKAIASFVDGVGPVLMRSPANSAATVGIAALAPPGLVCGRYVADGRVTDAAPEAYDARLAGELWDYAERLSGVSPHESLRL